MTEPERSKEDYGIDFERIKELVDKYDNDSKSGKIKRMSETDTRDDFINPLFKALGWDMENMLNSKLINWYYVSYLMLKH